MNLAQIKSAITAGQVVHSVNTGYSVILDKIGQYLICHHSKDCIGLTYQDGATLNGNEDEFFICEPAYPGLRAHIAINERGAFRFDISKIDGDFVATVISPDVVALNAYYESCNGYTPAREYPDITTDDLVVMVAGAILSRNFKG